MKRLFYICTIVIGYCSLSCSQGQSEAEKKADTIIAARDQSSSNLNGAFVKATINGKKWEASKMTNYGSESSYKLVNGETADYTISFQIHKPVTGLKREFNENNVANLLTEDDSFDAKKGQVTITKADEKWIEGNFHFTANNTRSNKTYEVTDGQFRIPNQ
jgi:hypothetical protein